MAAANRLKQIADERGQMVDQMIPALIDTHRTPYNVALALGVYPNTIRNWLEKHDYFFNKETKRWEKRQSAVA